MSFPGFDLQLLIKDLAKISGAYLLTLPIAWDRERESQGVGIRTFPIVAMASCGYLLLLAPEGSSPDFSRVLQGLMTGIGFVGGGAILKEGGTVRGTATAASIWCTAAIGSAIALERYDVGVILAVITFVTLKGLAPIKRRLDLKDE